MRKRDKKKEKAKAELAVQKRKVLYEDVELKRWRKKGTSSEKSSSTGGEEVRKGEVAGQDGKKKRVGHRQWVSLDRFLGSSLFVRILKPSFGILTLVLSILCFARPHSETKSRRSKEERNRER